MQGDVKGQIPSPRRRIRVSALTVFDRTQFAWLHSMKAEIKVGFKREFTKGMQNPFEKVSQKSLSFWSLSRLLIVHV